MASRKILLLIVSLLLAACMCSFPQAALGGPRVEIDAPADGSTLPLAPHEIIVRVIAGGGTNRSQAVGAGLTINGQLVTLNPANFDQSSVATFRYQWKPQQAGSYTITARAQDSTGNQSDLHTHVVTIVGATSTPTVPTPTASPTPTTTPTSTPTPPPAGGVTIQSVSEDMIYVGNASCGPVQETIVVHATAPKGIRVVVLFYRFEPGSPSGFQEVAMNPIGSDLYQATLNPTSLLGGSLGSEQATLQYQVVVQQKDGDTTIRTPVLADVAVEACGSVNPAPADCSSFKKQKGCESHGCNWEFLFLESGSTYVCRNP